MKQEPRKPQQKKNTLLLNIKPIHGNRKKLATAKDLQQAVTINNSSPLASLAKNAYGEGQPTHAATNQLSFSPPLVPSGQGTADAT